MSVLFPARFFTYHGQHLPAPDGETYVAERDHAGEAFVGLALPRAKLEFASLKSC